MGRSFGKRRVLAGASLWATPGRVSALFGRNGCGKTTLLRCATGLLRADYGVVHLGGRVTERPRLHRLARQGLFFLPAERLLSRREPLRTQLARVRAGRDRHASLESPAPELERLEIEPLMDRAPHTLSGGELRRAEVALALARQPLCLLADEPLVDVMPADGERIAAAIRSLAARGCAVIVTGHEVSELLALADEVVWLTDGGTTHGLGTPDEARAHHLFRREYLASR